MNYRRYAFIICGIFLCCGTITVLWVIHNRSSSPMPDTVQSFKNVPNKTTIVYPEMNEDATIELTIPNSDPDTLDLSLPDSVDCTDWIIRKPTDDYYIDVTDVRNEETIRHFTIINSDTIIIHGYDMLTMAGVRCVLLRLSDSEVDTLWKRHTGVSETE